MAQASAPIAAIRIKNILFATDFSEISSYAMPYVACIAKHFGATVFPTYVIPSEPHYEVPMDEIRENLTASRQDAERSFSKFLEGSTLSDLPKEVLIERGEVWPAINRVVNGYNVDLIVIGTHGRGPLGKIVFGSVAEQVYRKAPCPVLVVGPHAANHEIDGTFQRILFATDCSDASLAHLPFIVDLANAFGAFLRIVTVQEAKPTVLLTVDEAVAHKRQFLEDAIAKCRLVHEPEIVVEIGSITDEIVKVADVNNVDLIVMGARSTNVPSAHAHLPAGKTHFVAAHAHCPVLTLRV